MFRFAEPFWLLLVCILPLILCRRKPAFQTTYSSVSLIGSLPKSWKQRLLWLIPLFTALGWLCIILALSRPQTAVTSSIQTDRPNALVFVIDVSGSMGVSLDPIPDAQTDRSKLAVTKQVLREMLSSLSLSTPINFAAVVFSKEANIWSPLTSDRSAFLDRVEQLKVDVIENRTNIGDGIGLALAMVEKVPATSRAIVLFSDGAHNVESGLSLGHASRLAESLQTTIHTVAVGMENENDVRALAKIAEITSGSHLQIDQFSELQAAVDTLASAPQKPLAIEYSQWNEQFDWCLAAAVFFLTLTGILRLTWLRIYPE